ncbi:MULTISPECIES: fumarate reductase subunit FrdD [unclassified Agarivorans]|uniref:fumarate reductase subunit FrdD n=1 Tax=unclassified Agarivorans TaxID=2636026 RepID=UPI0010D4DCB3|nr:MULTISPECIES: fumarate reductase subunit FrdD [unclassified Agarivorans]MDO6687406.1 fumarate reductase subunit FrdD [Agarivorans sp. 3_MG-2023]MDO6715172.1 fumarate reductase subunit FrdD [Agarivorans sp. 2_MG-2023]MDO6763531.1 fumarate reductase subunit FrdD [Agarivorans sp. 1_MG-2023]GDY27206.1 fumarate reductase subunit D [Agarivorans sp. Toyoura001]
MKRSNEPVFWGMFGAGGMVAALFTPIAILITGLLVPLGIIPAEQFSYERVLAFSQHWLGAAVIWVIVSLPLWLCMHRLYHTLHDFGIHAGNLVKALFYGVAFAGSVACATLLLLGLI